MNSIIPQRPRVVAAGIAAAVLVGVVALFVVLQGEEEHAPQGRAPLTGPIDDGFVHRPLPPTETPDAEHGIVFVDVASGQGEFWTVPSAVNVEYMVDASHRWLVMSGFVQASSTPGPEGERFVSGAVIADRETGKSYRLNSRVLPQEGEDEVGWALIARPEQPPWLLGPTPEGLLVVQSQSEAGLFAVVDLARDPTGIAREFSLPIATSSFPRINTAIDLNGDLLAIVSEDQGPDGKPEDFSVVCLGVEWSNRSATLIGSPLLTPDFARRDSL